MAQQWSVAISVAYRSSNVVYRPRNVVYRPRNLTYSPSNVVYRPINVAYSPSNVAYEPVTQHIRQGNEAQLREVDILLALAGRARWIASRYIGHLT
jgi:hypothetical protein